MHKFKRPEEPQGLIDARAKKETWETFRKAELTECLHRAQDGCCAYCDMKLKRDEKGRLKAHIEHLSRRCENRTGVFDWENLFLSCEHSESCGKYKDKQYKKLQNGAPVNVENIVDPSKEEPLDYFLYTVFVRIVALKDDEKAQTTINTFNLNAKHLVGARREAMEVVRYFIEDYERTEQELRVEWKNDEEVDEYLREILENFLTQNNESDFFSSVYRSVWRRLQS